MLSFRFVCTTAAVLYAVLFAPVLNAKQEAARPEAASAEVSERKANIWSEGTRMSGTVYVSSAARGEKLPTILMAHGWGGTASALRRDALGFAQAGYLVVTFDYRGWGESDSRIILAKPTAQRPAGDDRTFSAEVLEVREVVDPIDMVADWQNALHWLHGEPRVDTSRIGVWGSSQSGGFVAELATRDHRIKAVYSQVGAFDARELGRTREAYIDATKRARGEIGYPEPGLRVLGNLRGAPIYARFANYAPVDHINDAGDIPMRIVVAEHEELFDNDQQGILAYRRYNGPKDLVIVPGITHYGVYLQAWPQAHQLALEWFDRYLKPR
jgi:dienelactone hydrolase